MINGLPKRKQLRLKGYDYSQNGYYFVTICTESKGNVLGEIKDNQMALNDAGDMVSKWWVELKHKFPTTVLWEYVVMPNHIHGIIEIKNIVGAGLCACPPIESSNNFSTGGHAGPPLPDIVRWFKTMTTNAYYQKVKEGMFVRIKGKLWQRNYYEHIIRSDEELQEIRRYISNNPKNWKKDKLYFK